MEAAAMRNMTPRRSAMMVVLAALLLGFRFWGQEPSGNRAYRNAAYPKAVERYRAALSRGGSTPRLDYNLGTALFQIGESEEAQRMLETALRAQAPELRARAFYNLGNVLAQGSAVSAETLQYAIEAYRRSLMLEPQSDNARWNLELALRRLEELERNRPPFAGSEGQAEAPQQPGAGAAQRPREGAGEAPLPQPGDTQRQRGAAEDQAEPPFPLELAEQILRAVEDRERGLQREKLRRQRRRASGPDW
jgi:Ca-activated chloride channel family protein